MKKIIYLVAPLMCFSTLISCGGGGNKPDSNTCTVTWKNDDSTVLLTQTYNKGEVPSYPYYEPTKEDDNYYYRFDKWDKEITNVYEDTVYTAQYNNKFKLGDTVLTINVPNSNYDFAFDSIVAESGLYFVDWGDGEETVRVSQHTYKNPGIYDIKLTNVISFNIKQEASFSYVGLGDLITEVKDRQFGNYKDLEKVRLSKNLTSIGIEAFEGCEKLKCVFFPDSLISISSYAFSDCTSLCYVDMSVFERTIYGDMNMFLNCNFIENKSIRLKDEEMLDLYKKHANFDYYADYMFC